MITTSQNHNTGVDITLDSAHNFMADNESVCMRVDSISSLTIYIVFIRRNSAGNVYFEPMKNKMFDLAFYECGWVSRWIGAWWVGGWVYLTAAYIFLS